MFADTFSTPNGFIETGVCLVPTLLEEGAAGRSNPIESRFRCLKGQSGRSYMFCAVSAARAGLYRDCILAVSSVSNAARLSVVKQVPKGADCVYVHCLDGDDLVAVENDLRTHAASLGNRNCKR